MASWLGAAAVEHVVLVLVPVEEEVDHEQVVAVEQVVDPVAV